MNSPLVFFGVLFVALLSGVSHAQIYKTVDENGNVVFTDVAPKDDAKPLQIQPGNTFGQPERQEQGQLGANFDDSEQDPAEQVTLGYANLVVQSPTNDQAIRQNSGDVTVAVAPDPALNADHQIQILLDGAVVQTAAAASITLNNVDRGTHSVQAQIIDLQGNVLIHSETTIFHLLRYSAL